MDYKALIEEKDGLRLTGVKNFHPRHVFECGQAFRWDRLDEDGEHYRGVVAGKVLEVKREGEDLFLRHATREDFDQGLRRYFDFGRAYTPLKKRLAQDPCLKEAVKEGWGIRILQQDPFETLISFILSSNNGIPKIRQGIRAISARYGRLIPGEGDYAFPTPEELSRATVEELYGLGVGYRAKYIHGATAQVCEAKRLKKESQKRSLTAEEEEAAALDLEELARLSTEECYERLQKFVGVGPKVADCIMLFSLGKTGAFPVDVWMKKAMHYFYQVEGKSLPRIREAGQERFGTLAGFAQQYLFFYAREKKIRIE